MTKRERAIEIVDNYCLYHAGTAVFVGALGGQFGVDRIALTALTISMINEICNVYEITDTTAVNIHITNAITRLTCQGTALAHTILNYIPLGSIANGATTYFLTRSAGRRCIADIEEERMNSHDQIIEAVKDTGKLVLSNSYIGNIVEDSTDGLTENIISQVSDTFDCDELQNLGVDKIIKYIDGMSIETSSGINKALGSALKNSLIELLNCDSRKFDTSAVLRNVFFDTISIVIEEHDKKLSREEIRLRILANDEHSQTFISFMEDMSVQFESIEKEKGVVEAVDNCVKRVSSFLETYYGLTANVILNNIFDNTFDKENEFLYHLYLPLIEHSDNYLSIWAKSVMLYCSLNQVNIRYKTNKETKDGKDNSLIYMIAGRIKNNLLTNTSLDSIAYNISQLIEQQTTYFEYKAIIPIADFNRTAINENIENIKNKHISFWIDIINHSNSEQGIWSDCIALYIQIFYINHFKEQDLFKDDILIYTIAEEVKKKTQKLVQYTVEQIAYFIAEFYDKLY